LKEAVSLPQIRAQRAQSSTDLQQDQPKRLQVGLDEDWLPSCEQIGGMEGKIGTVASQPKPVGKHGRYRLSRLRNNERLKKRGMWWKRANATTVVALRVQRINADWEATVT